LVWIITKLKKFLVIFFDELPNFLGVDLSYNKLTKLPDGLFINNPLVTELDFANNMIEHIGNIFGETSKLKRIDFSFNNLLSLGNINMIPNLVYLNISNNPNLMNLPSDLTTNMPHLTYVNFSNIGISTLDPQMINNKKLKELDISKNHLTNLDNNLFNNLRKLEVFYCHNNHLKNIPNLLRSNLRIIDASYNELDNFSLSNIQTVLLRQNNLKYIHIERVISDLRTLDVRDNRLVFLEPGILKGVNLEYLDIVGNPWDCHCLTDILKIIQQRNIKYDKADYFTGSRAVCVTGNYTNCRNVLKVKDSDVINKYYQIFKQ